MGKNRLELRRMAEAAEKQKKDASSSGTTKRKATKRKTTKRKTTSRKTKEKGLQRKRIVWCVFNGSMKEEGRFPYDQKEAAEAKLEQLRGRSKKLYFMQAVKEVLSDSAPPVSAPVEDEEVEETPTPTAEDSDEDEDLDEDDTADDDDDGDDEEE